MLVALSSVAALGVNILVQILSFYFIARAGLFKSVLFGFIGGAAALSVLAALGCFNSIGTFLLNSTTYVFLSYGYFSFLGLLFSARRSFLLREIAKHPEGVSLEQILLLYNAHDMIELRMERLVAKKQVIEKNGKYFIGIPFVLILAKTVKFMQAIAAPSKR